MCDLPSPVQTFNELVCIWRWRHQICVRGILRMSIDTPNSKHFKQYILSYYESQR